ncbi:hypothetical protein N7475_005613 [Penicillium sp. IBT 31633x]|nr:hypothetical protein N7475_005613 [Penicillium sp. IBT 31633x]
MSSLRESVEVDIQSNEAEVNARRGYKSILNTPKVSKESKHNALDILHDELGGDAPRYHADEVSIDESKESRGLAGDLERSQRNISQRENDSIEQRDQYPG